MNFLKCMKCGETTNILKNIYLYDDDLTRYSTKVCVPCACELISSGEWVKEERGSRLGRYTEVESESQL